MLLGQGNYVTPQQQAGAPRQLFVQTSEIAAKAWRKVPDSGVKSASFATIHQGAREVYIDFIERLQMAIIRQVNDQEAADTLLLQLAFENANADCQKVLLPVNGRTKEIGRIFETVPDCGYGKPLGHDIGSCYYDP